MNIVSDILKLVKDLKQSFADGKIEKDEAARILLDLAEVMKELATLLPLIVKAAPKR